MKRKIFHTPFGRCMAQIAVAHKKNNVLRIKLTANSALRAHMPPSLSELKHLTQVLNRLPRHSQDKLFRTFTAEIASEFIEHVLLAKLKKAGGLNESFDAQAFLESQESLEKA